MDVYREIQSLLESGLRFSIELNGRSVQVWVGDYLREHAAAYACGTLDQAVLWLRQDGHGVGVPLKA